MLVCSEVCISRWNREGITKAKVLLRRDEKGYPKVRRVGEVREKKGMRGWLAGQKKKLETETLFFLKAS